MARRRNAKRRRQNLIDVIGPCEGWKGDHACPAPAYRKVFIPDGGRDHVLCEQHAAAIEFQMTRNRAAAATKERRATEERLGLR